MPETDELVEQVQRIRGYVELIDKEIFPVDCELLQYTVYSVIDRALLYLNHEKLETRFERIIAEVVDGIFRKFKNNLNTGNVENAVSSISDNGQSISYSNEIRNYLQSSSDNELFGGFTNVLARYRRPRML